MNDSKFIEISFKFPAKSYANHLFETLVFDRLEISKSRRSFSIFVLKNCLCLTVNLDRKIGQMSLQVYNVFVKLKIFYLVHFGPFI